MNDQLTLINDHLWQPTGEQISIHICTNYKKHKYSCEWQRNAKILSNNLVLPFCQFGELAIAFKKNEDPWLENGHFFQILCTHFESPAETRPGRAW